ncbi:MAG: hypothetical protein HZA04_00020 [Nitrospinae bacterium]|nr:hypothetical protein [Nitrospinota bacterium]
MAAICAVNLCSPFAVAAEKIPLAGQLAAPLTVPKEQTDMGPGLDFIEKQDGSGWYTYPAFYLRHGLADDVELIPLGLRYRFYANKEGHQAAVKARLAGMADSSSDEAFYSWETAVEGKFPAAPELAVTYGIGNYRTEYTKGTFADVADVSAGVLVSMGKMLAAEIGYAHQFVWGLQQSNADSVTVTVFWNAAPGAVLTLATTSNYLPKNDSFRFYGIGGISQAYTLGVMWQF